MIPSAIHLRDFYRTLGGRIARRLIREKIISFWPETKGLDIVGAGYAAPYLKPYSSDAARVVTVMFRGQGVHHWPETGLNATCLSEEGELPFETNSVDRIVLIHALEYSGHPKNMLDELWRVLKSNGRILIAVPHRNGLWTRADWTPFGHGAPFSARQACDLLKGSFFVPERTEKGLFVPPFKTELLLRSASFWEKAGPYICPVLGGLVFVEASKQIYAPTGKSAKSYLERKPAVAALPGTVSPNC